LTAADLCRDCPELLPEVERRLDALRWIDSFLDTHDSRATPALGASAPGPGAPPPSLAGYEVLQEVGRGGMGVVYQARHTALKRLVAIKMILVGPHAGAADLARFRAEAEAVARLKHPNIVEIHDIGEAAGRPYFSLEWVEGGSLEKKLAGTPLPPRDAAELLEALARAAHYAHERGIVHRDLKPANVLLTADGRPKITDFGLAKQLEGDAGKTQSGSVLGTPSYMAPEQAAGDVKTIDARTDVYALGATLYELLTGRPPFKGTSLLDTLEQVRFAEPVPPSRLQMKVPRDLETVCLKCLRKEPPKRYESALALAEDLRRYLNHEPIRARPVGPFERGWRWCRRNPALAGLSAALLLILVGGLVGLTALWRHAEGQRHEAVEARERAQEMATQAHDQKKLAQEQARLARAQAEKARRETNKADWTAQMLTEMFQAADPLGLAGIPALRPKAGEALTARQILDRAAEKVARDLYLKEEPETQAKLMDTLGNVYATLGQIDKAKPLLEKALALRRRSLPKDHSDLATSLHNLGWLHHQTGDYAAANRFYRQALAIRRKHARADPGALSQTMLLLGWLLNDLEDYPAAERMFQGALDLRVRSLGPDHRDTAVPRVALVGTYITQGKFLKAIPLYKRAMRTLRKVEGGGGLVESIELLQKGIIGREVPLMRWMVGLKDERAVEECFQRSLLLARKTLGDRHAYVALVLHELACTLAKHHKEEAAERYFAECWHLVEKYYGLDHPKATILLANYAALLKRRGKQTEADRVLETALKVRRQRHPANHFSIADALVIQAALQEAAGSSRLRRKSLREALAIYCRSPGPPRAFTARCVRLLGTSLSAVEMYDVARELASAAAKRGKRSREGDRYFDLSMQALRRARDMGFKDRERLRGDDWPDGLRRRADFQQLAAKLQGASDR
jgi:tetratricopeptide (TPR) repeat protein